MEEEENIGPIPFRFSTLWIERDGLWETRSQAWSQFVEGSPSYLWEQKLKWTKITLKSWIKSPLENPMRFRVDTVQPLADIQFSMENTKISKVQLTVEQSTQSSQFTAFHHEEEH